MLDVLLEVPDGSRVSEWDRLRKGPRKASGPGMVKALNRVSELAGLRLGELDLAVVPPWRVAELARYGLAGKTPALKRHQDERRLATLLASVHHLEHVATDDALELLDLLVVIDLLARAARETDKEKLRRYGSFSRASAKLAAAVEVLLEATGFGEEITLEQLWESIEAVVPRRELADAVAAVTDIAPPPDADPDGEWRAELTKRIATVRGFLPLLCEVIAFGATAEGEPALAAMRRLPEALAFRSGKLKAGEIPARMVDEGLVTSEWRRLVFRPGASEKAADRAAYVFCVLEKFHRHLRRRDIYAETSTRWRDPRAQLLDGEAWQRAKGPALTALCLPEDPDALLASHARRLDATYREVAGRLVVNTDVRVDADGKLHVAHIEAVPDPASLTDLRDRLQAMLPKVDLPELILEVMAWHPAFTDAFTAVSGGESRLADLNVSVAAVLTSHALNVGYAPIIAPGVPALERDRLSHVDQNYMRAETYKTANAALIEAQAGIGLAREWGGGLVAAIDGIRFVVPIPTIHARPNPKYWGGRRGAQWINMMNDQFAGTGGIVVAGTPRDSLHAIDVISSQDGGARPEVIITGTASYTDIVFGLLSLLGFSYRPQLADLPDQKLWRIDVKADYGPLNTAARGRVDLEAIRRHWPDILRITASIHTCTVRAHDVLRAISRDGHPTPPHPAGQRDRRLRPGLQVPARADLHRRRRLPPRHQGHAQPAGIPARPGAARLPRQEGRAAAEVPRGDGIPARRARPGPELHHAVEHDLPGRRPGRPARQRVPGPRGRRRPAHPLHAQAHQCPRALLFRASRPARRPPPAARPGQPRRGRRTGLGTRGGGLPRDPAGYLGEHVRGDEHRPGPCPRSRGRPLPEPPGGPGG